MGFNTIRLTQPASLVAYYPLDSVNDLSGNGYTLTQTSGTFTNQGKFGNCYNGDGIGTYLTSGNIVFGNTGSVTLWFKPDVNIGVGYVPAGYRYFFRNGNSLLIARFYIAAGGHDGQLNFVCWDGVSEINIYGDSFNYLTPIWYFMSFTWSNTSGVKMYRNGNIIASSATNAAALGTTTFILGRPGEAGLIDGSFNICKVYNEVLTPQAIRKEYAIGVGKFY